MHKVADIVDAARKLSREDRRRLLAELASLESQAPADPAQVRGRYAALRTLSGTIHSEFTDISTDKYAHVGVVTDPDSDG